MRRFMSRSVVNQTPPDRYTEYRRHWSQKVVRSLEYMLVLVPRILTNGSPHQVEEIHVQ